MRVTGVLILPEMKAVGVNAYRFSVSWSRVIPKGGANDPINEQGVQYYNDLIDECVRLGMTPFVVGQHLDLHAKHR